MNTLRKMLLIVSFLVSIGVLAQKPKIRIIATGGTIAGVSKSATESNYKAGELGIYQLLDAVPEVKEIAQVSGEQLVKIGSQDMNDDVWLKLAKRINELLNKEGYDGIVITHGTDTMEETAYFLNLTVHSSKPVVMVGAMRPATGMSADGPLNLYNAVSVAASPNASGRGVMVCMNDIVLDAKDVIKSNTTEVQTFIGANYGKLAYLHNGKVFFNRTPQNKHTNQSVFNVDNLKSLPRVGIVYGYSNASDLPMKAFIDAKYDGVVYAGVGNGNFYHTLFDLAVKARSKGIQVVRSSRVPTGATTLDAEVDDAKYQFVAAQALNPQKARVLLMLALTQTKDWRQIQQYFNEY
ncbi:L-asparaginase 2 [Capnocytophaga catalasegens]|uniref:L-asparaginase 2 n=1 Tax=Capnocytophaga catalasegens TaxID=1004260 RepID=A0AAV5AV58_9FLAO|nr:L-asparaginase 2 [Capnocytophaga catalasegens]GJM49741.1 L-asparaginase 2 [Capnocytophaga catalasegens]GJM52806.1 L-asparaginase 2 [Capnocytophaga catalasegens]